MTAVCAAKRDTHAILRQLEQRHIDGDASPASYEECMALKDARDKLNYLYELRPGLKGKVRLSEFLEVLLGISDD